MKVDSIEKSAPSQKVFLKGRGYCKNKAEQTNSGDVLYDRVLTLCHCICLCGCNAKSQQLSCSHGEVPQKRGHVAATFASMTASIHSQSEFTCRLSSIAFACPLCPCSHVPYRRTVWFARLEEHYFLLVGMGLGRTIFTAGWEVQILGRPALAKSGLEPRHHWGSLRWMF